MLLEEVCTRNPSRSVVMGDFNDNLLASAGPMNAILRRLPLDNHVHLPTRVTATTSTLLDLLLGDKRLVTCSQVLPSDIRPRLLGSAALSAHSPQLPSPSLVHPHPLFSSPLSTTNVRPCAAPRKYPSTSPNRQPSQPYTSSLPQPHPYWPWPSWINNNNNNNLRRPRIYTITTTRTTRHRDSPLNLAAHLYNLPPTDIISIVNPSAFKRAITPLILSSICSCSGHPDLH